MLEGSKPSDAKDDAGEDITACSSFGPVRRHEHSRPPNQRPCDPPSRLLRSHHRLRGAGVRIQGAVTTRKMQLSARSKKLDMRRLSLALYFRLTHN